METRLFVLFSSHLDAYHVFLRDSMVRVGTVAYNRGTGGWHRLISVQNGTGLPEVHYDLSEFWLTRNAALLELLRHKIGQAHSTLEHVEGIVYKATQPVVMSEVPSVAEPAPLLRVLQRRSGNVVSSSPTAPPQAESPRAPPALRRPRIRMVARAGRR